jgi:calcineurin-like phosphoesterase family protein
MGMGSVLAAAMTSLGPASGLAATAPPQAVEPGRAVVWAVGDGADGSARSKRLARLMARGADRLLYLGDVYERGTAAEFRRNFGGVYGSLARITEPTPGNHDWGRRRAGYYPYWERIKGRTQPPWYRVSIAGWQLFSLNSEAAHGTGSSQLRWLRARLRGAKGDCRLAFWHRPLLSAGIVHGDAPDLAPLWNALRGGFRLVVNGHDHDLQRLRRRQGITELVAGAGGRALYPLRRWDDRLAFGRDDVNGALRMVLSPGTAMLEFRSSSGAVLDRSRARCRPG